jgi:hypothetical protein
MKPGDLIRLRADGYGGTLTVWYIKKNAGGFKVPAGSIALVLKIEMNPSHNDPDDHHVNILVDGKLGWIYPEDCEVINEAR